MFQNLGVINIDDFVLTQTPEMKYEENGGPDLP